MIIAARGTLVSITAALAFAAGTATRDGAPAAAMRPVAPARPITHPATHPAPIHHAVPGTTLHARGMSSAALSAVVQRYCQSSCHNARTLKGNLSLEGFDVDSAPARLATSEKMIRKLRAQIMPPPGSRRPGGDTLVALVESIENVIDKAARPNPGARTFQRLNRPEYEHAVRDLLGVELNAGDYLPLDTKSANFDNIADVQALSPTLLESYLNAAAAVSRIALGDRSATNLVTTYTASPLSSQHAWDHVEGAPYGTRGGIVADHPFPADGMYTFRMNVEGGIGTKLEDIDVSIDGARVALLHYERAVERSSSSADNILGMDYIRTEPIRVNAGQQRVSATWVRRAEGPYEDLIKPHEWSQAGHGSSSSGTTNPPHVLELAVIGPDKPGPASDSRSRRMIFSCRPKRHAPSGSSRTWRPGRTGVRSQRTTGKG
jgi:hypothetical protein